MEKQRQPLCNIAQKSAVQLALLFAGNLVLALLVMALFGTRWENNDDYTMAAIVSGVYGQSSVHLVFASSVLGAILRVLYAVVPGLNWYWLFELFAVVLSYTVIGWVLQQRQGKRWGRLFYLVFLVASCQTFYYHWNFTRTAAIAAAAGALCMLQGLKNARGCTPLWVGGALFYYGFCLRFESWLMALALALAWLAGEVLVWFTAHRSVSCIKTAWKARRKQLAVCGAVVLVILATKAVDLAVNAQEPWKDYLTYNKARHELYDYNFPEYEEARTIFEAAGISEEDYQLYLGWNHCDNEKLTTSVMLQLVEARGKARQRLSPWLVVNAAQRFVDTPMFLLGVVLTLFGVLCMKKTNWAALFSLYAASVVLLSYLMYVSRFPDRVVSSIGVCFSMFVAASFCMPGSAQEGNGRTQGPNWLQTGAAALGVLFLLDGTHLCNPDTWRNREMSAQQMRARRTALAEQLEPDKLYLYQFVSGPDFWTLYPLWQTPPKGLEAHFYPMGGWNVQLPVLKASLAQFGVENPLGDAATTDDLLMISVDLDGIEQCAAYLRRNYTPDTSWSVYDVMGSRLVVSFTRPMQPGPVCEAVPHLQEITQQEGYQAVQLALDGVTCDADTVYCLVLQDEDGEQVTLRTKAQPTETGVLLWVGIPYSEWAEDAPLTGYVAARAENTTETLWQTETVTLAA